MVLHSFEETFDSNLENLVSGEVMKTMGVCHGLGICLNTIPPYFSQEKPCLYTLTLEFPCNILLYDLIFPMSFPSYYELCYLTFV